MDMGPLLGIFFGDGTLLAGDFMVCNKEIWKPCQSGQLGLWLGLRLFYTDLESHSRRFLVGLS